MDRIEQGAGFRGVLSLARGLGWDRDHVALGQMVTHAATQTCVSFRTTSAMVSRSQIRRRA
jgi:hypothetical protein